jgi:predicted anti-sigma-YlaC factor YlaD
VSCNRIETDGMRYLDGEMSSDERIEFERHVASCDDCRAGMREMAALERLTGMLTIRDPMDDFWERYWKSIFRRLERKIGWILLILGAVMIAGWQIYHAVTDFGRITFGKVALVVLIAGALILLVSVIRERIHQYRTDRYRDIMR